MTARISLNLRRTGGHRPPLQSEHFLPLGKAHHRKEGWPSDQKIIAKAPLIPASASVAARNFLDDAATPPCGDARRGITLDSNLFTTPMSADSSQLRTLHPTI